VVSEFSVATLKREDDGTEHRAQSTEHREHGTNLFLSSFISFICSDLSSSTSLLLLLSFSCKTCSDENLEIQNHEKSP
jgi:hypothetical protein